jgi:glucose/arabinose dehydrogenase
MKRFLMLVAIVFSLLSSVAVGAETPTQLAGPFVNPESVCYGPNGLLYITEIGEGGKDGDGKVTVIKDGQPQPFATGLDDPKGMVFYKNLLFVTDKTKVVQVDANGQTQVFAASTDFPRAPVFLNDIAVEVRNGLLIVSDSGDKKGQGGAAYRIDFRTKKIDIVADNSTIPALHTPNGVVFDGESHFLLADMAKGLLYRVNLTNRSATQIADGLDGADGLAWDHFGRLFITSWTTGKIYGAPQPGKPPILIGAGLKSAADCCLSSDGRRLLIPDMKAGTLTELSTAIPGWEVDESPLAIEAQVAFPNLKLPGWDDGSESGKVVPLRPIVLTHANDQSNRVFLATQFGVIHFFDNKDDVKESKVFLDISDRVSYNDKQNEEGFLGLAFHPKFAQNGEFFVFYTDAKAKLTNVVSRFHVKSDDKLTADPASEEQLIRFEKPFWNHDGGCLIFGPDGYLYVSHGDGGAGGDPYENGQNLKTLLGKVLRIDVDHKAEGKNYAIPADNPFASKPDARPEIFAYGLRNVWRMAFDRETGVLWGGEVGQNVYEEIVLLKSGGNFGWNLREAFHPFGAKGVDVRDDLIEPIWEYDHDVGKSITGGAVYRGKAIPELQGAYIYSDYVTTPMWALRYDPAKGRVTANRPIVSPKLAVTSFGEDEQGELYALIVSGDGKAIYRLARSAAKP